MSEPDFEALRAERNAKQEEFYARMKAEYGLEALHKPDPNRCYCGCSTGGPCEHKWDGEPYENEEEGVWSATCSRCGCTAMSHSLRTGC